MYIADYHVHSSCSPDGKATMSEMAEAAVSAGLDELCFTDHMDTVSWHDMAPRWDFPWDEARRQFDEAQNRWGDRITLKLGAEIGEAYLAFDRADYLVDHTPDPVFLIGSVHMLGKRFDYKDLYYVQPGDAAHYRAVIDSYLEEMKKLVAWGRFHVLGHLTLPLRYINENFHAGLTFDAHRDAVAAIFRTIIGKGIGIECNTNRGNAPLPDADLLTLYRDLGGEIITLGSDAHTPDYVGCAIRQRQELLRECGFRYFTTFTKGKPEFRPL